MLKARATRDAGFCSSLGTNFRGYAPFPFRLLQAGIFYAPLSSGEAVGDSKESPANPTVAFTRVATFLPHETPTIYSNQLLSQTGNILWVE